MTSASNDMSSSTPAPLYMYVYIQKYVYTVYICVYIYAHLFLYIVTIMSYMYIYIHTHVFGRGGSRQPLHQVEAEASPQEQVEVAGASPVSEPSNAVLTVFTLLPPMAVSTNWGCFLWVSLQQEPYYLESILGPLISGHSLNNIEAQRGPPLWRIVVKKGGLFYTSVFILSSV